MNEAVKEYQCCGCVSGGDCYVKGFGLECDKHVAGTVILPIGKVLLGLPKGFNRIGGDKNFYLYIFENKKEFDNSFGFDKFNIPVWKYKNNKNHTLVRAISPRTNMTFITIILENCLSNVDCLEIKDSDIEEMD